MGFNTAVIVLNDTMHDFDKDPHFGGKLQSAILSASRTEGRGPCNTRVLPSQHADTMQIIAVGGNDIRFLGYGSWRDTPEQLLRKLAAQLGFRVSRIPAPKP